MLFEPQQLISALGAGEAADRHERQPQTAYGAFVTRWCLAGGLLLFIVLLWRIGANAVGQQLLRAGWALPLVFVPYALTIACETSAWWCAFPRGESVRVLDLVRLTVAAKAVQLLTPSIVQAGEFLKVHLLRATGVRMDLGPASVVIAKTTMTIGELLFIGLGLTFVFGYTAVDHGMAKYAWLGMVVMGAGVAGMLVWQRTGVFRPLRWISRRIGPLGRFVDRHEALLRSTEGFIRAHLDEKWRFGLSCAWFFLAWASGIIEAWALLVVLGLPPDVSSAVAIQAWSAIVTRLTTFIPGNLGAQEAGVVVIFSFLGLSPESAMAFAVLRRLRQLAWIAGGLGCLAKLSRT
jgi:glycosyltransferase 2 family protein